MNEHGLVASLRKDWEDIKNKLTRDQSAHEGVELIVKCLEALVAGPSKANEADAPNIPTDPVAELSKVLDEVDPPPVEQPGTEAPVEKET